MRPATVERGPPQRPRDEQALEPSDVGDPPSLRLDEVSEIGAGLLAWRDEEALRDSGRVIGWRYRQ